MINTNYATGSLTDCSIMLYVMTERFPSARKYRDVFERIKLSVFAIIEQGKQQPARKLSWGDDMRARCVGLESGLDMGGGKEEFSWMIGEMTGSAAISGQNSATIQVQQSDMQVNGQSTNGFANGLDEYMNLDADWSTLMVDTGDMNGGYTGWGAVGRM